MIPSLVADDLKRAVIEYLTTTFAIGDDATREELTRFLGGDPESGTPGIFRGPFLRVRAPFKAVEEGWKPALDWLPEGFRPYLHQARSHERLNSIDQTPRPTLVTTGTGSGKTECFLHPILDHCLRHRGEPGIKAIILYPMNALATDQAGRIAEAIHEDDRLDGITAGLYLGEGSDGEFHGQGVMTADSVITDRYSMRRLPPDILLTNYRMLDFLLLRQEDRDLWANTGPESLRYLVLDEFHTYDGAQGTDVAMLLRRMGIRLGLNQPGRPLGDVAPVATSATLGGGINKDAMCEFASKVFGVEFEPESVIGEARQEAEECLAPIDFDAGIPAIADISTPEHLEDIEELAASFIGRRPEDQEDLGAALLSYRLTRTLFEELSGEPRPVEESLERIVRQTPEWAADFRRDPAATAKAVVLFLALLSWARRPGGTPLLTIEAQLWVREVSRLLRAVDLTPAFRWSDDPGTGALYPGAAPDHRQFAPAVYCRACGRTGWMGRTSEVDGSIGFKVADIYGDSPNSGPQLRTLILAAEGEMHLADDREESDPSDDEVRYFDAASGEINATSAEGLLPVIVTPDEDWARANRCPSCGSYDDITFIGSRIASLASVTLSQLFGSDFAGVPKLLSFADSVQDASHRAAFFNARTFRFNLRTQLAQAISEGEGRVTLAGLGSGLVDAARSAATTDEARRRLHDLVPVDLLDMPAMKSLWNGTADPDDKALEVLRRRIEFEAQLEFGLRSRLGRTLELSGAVAARVELEDVKPLADLTVEIAAEALPIGVLIDVGRAEVLLHGLLERLRLQGAIGHAWLKRYIETGGKRWQIWGNRPDGMQAFPTGLRAPAFLWDGPASDSFDRIGSSGGLTWVTDWSARVLGIEPSESRLLAPKVIGALAEYEVLRKWTSESGQSVYGLDPEQIWIEALSETDHYPLKCDVCSSRHTVPGGDPDGWEVAPCLRYRCRGHYRADVRDTGTYYRDLYLTGSRTRVVAAEHIGALKRTDRVALEERFKDGGRPGDPNVLSCTPTLEMGVDIGDLDSVMLTSVPKSPASYLQRVGRAGRKSGNSFVSTFVPARSRGLYFLERPIELIDGEVVPPDCWLDAIEILRRQYFAFLMDRAAAGVIEVPQLPRQLGMMLKSISEEGGFLHGLLTGHEADPELYVREFLGQFTGQVSEKTRDRLFEYAKESLRGRVTTAAEGWLSRYQVLRNRQRRLGERVKRLQEKAHLTEDEQLALNEVESEHRSAIRAATAMAKEYSLSGLERIGLLPNYNLGDEGVAFSGTAWWKSKATGDPEVEEEFVAEEYEASRNADLAIRELAPGASFYTAGKRFRIDQIEFPGGAAQAKTMVRACPDCAYVGPEDVTVCPRCHRNGIADAKARFASVDLKAVASVERAEDARVEDRNDERDRVPFSILTTVDVDLANVHAAWKLPDNSRPFGVELAEARINWLNLGRSDRQGEEVEIAGETRKAPGFETCLHCGVVQGAKADPGKSDNGQHRGWCQVRSGGRPNNEKLILTHSLDTEVVRMILPMADFEVEERLATFKAALMLGLRLNLGGSPDHLRVLISSSPGGQEAGSRRRYLVVRDTVPGGTGYLERLTDFEELCRILSLARQTIYRCECRDEGRRACYRCLLSEADWGEEELVSRELAVSMLDELLEHWKPGASGQPATQPITVATISDLPIDRVEESELERRLRLSMVRWAEVSEGVSIQERPGSAKHKELELRVPLGGPERYAKLEEEERKAHPTLRYRIREQFPSNSQPATIPDFLITRMDGESPPVAVYSDGFQFHAHPDVRNTLADDAEKRAGARAFGNRVWSMDWNDVVEFWDSVGEVPPATPPSRQVLSNGPRLQVARQVREARGGGLDTSLANANPLSQMLAYLCDPDGDEWRRLAKSAVAGLVTGAAQESDNSAIRFTATTDAGLVFFAKLDVSGQGGANSEFWDVSAVLDDSEAAVNEASHRSRWREWLWWGNLLQFLDGGGCSQAVTVSSLVSGGGAPDPSEAGDPPEVETAKPDDFADELEFAGDSCRELLSDVLAAGAPRPEIGHELGDGSVVEAAWPESRVGVIVAGQKQPEGWETRLPENWDTESLLAAVRDGKH